ncbi:MAG: Gmad2 immunoglobulin-like domain-containing protein [Acidimicrobiia bacterium]|jgi:hypothetical protein
MSDEKKLKDLIRRLVAMTPEPPPLPEEEVPMARRETPRNRRPVLVFAGAAVLVIALAVPLLLFFRGSVEEAVATTTTLAPVTTTAPRETTTTTSTSTTIVPAFIWHGEVFLTQEPENSLLGNPALVPFDIQLLGTADVSGSPNFSEILPLMDMPSGFSNAIPVDVRVLSTSLPRDGVIEVEMNEAFLDGAGGLLADFTMLNQLIYTLTSAPGVDNSDSVMFLVNGQPVSQFGTEGLDLSDRVNRQTFIDELALIFLTDPIHEAEHVYTVFGLANTYEAMLTAQVIDASGDVVHEEPVEATCGTGCWGGFGVGVASDLIEPGRSSIRLLTYSAEDGSPENVITIPIPEDSPWKFIVGE